MPASEELLDRLIAALEQTRDGAPTRPVSVTLPAPLAEAFRLLANEGLIDSVSVVAAQALEDVLQARVVAMRLERLYSEDPSARPDESRIAALAATVGIDL